MYGVTFGNIHSYDDLDLILTDVEIGTPEPVRYTVEVPGANGVMDLTEAITPRIRYKTRTITFSFATKQEVSNWDSVFRNIMNLIHGQKFHVVQDTDPNYYWDAFCRVDSIKSNVRLGTVVISCECQPYKLKLTKTTKTKTGNGTLNCTNARMETSPTITCTAACNIEFGEETISLAAGTHLVDFIFDEGDNELEITSTGTTTVVYQEGAL